MARIKQTKAASHIRELLVQRGFNIPSRKLSPEDSSQWVILEYNSRQLGIDTDSGVWVRASELEDWQGISLPCTVSGALQAVEFLTGS